MTHIRIQKVKVKGYSVHKLERKQTDGRTDGRTGGDCIASRAVGNKAVGDMHAVQRTGFTKQARGGNSAVGLIRLDLRPDE